MRVSFVLPAHNAESDLARTVPIIRQHLSKIHRGSEIIIVENGSTDGTAGMARSLAADAPDGVSVRVETSEKGLGHALRRGVAVARGDLIVCTAADLPFGFSDVDAVAELVAPGVLFIGSKAHPDSVTERRLLRSVMSLVFRGLRAMLLGSRVRDPQGSLLMESAVARHLFPLTQESGYLVSTEVVMLAERSGIELREIPVIYPRQERSSTVRPLRDSWAMLTGLLRLRRRSGTTGR